MTAQSKSRSAAAPTHARGAFGRATAACVKASSELTRCEQPTGALERQTHLDGAPHGARRSKQRRGDGLTPK